jgi:hypothetical protein
MKFGPQMSKNAKYWWSTSSHPELHPSNPDGFLWNKVCGCVLWPWKHVSTILNHENWTKNEWKNAKYMSWASRSPNSWWILIKQTAQMDSTHLITYIHHFKSLKKTQKPLRHHTLMGLSQKGSQRPQKRKDSRFFVNLGTSTYAKGVTNLGTL